MTPPGVSLRRRLLTGILGAVPLLWLGAAYLTHLEWQQEVDRLLDAQLAQAAQTLLRVAQRDAAVAASMVPSGDRYVRRVVFQVWDADGVLVARSEDAPRLPLADGRGFADRVRDGVAWRTYSERDSRTRMVVHVAEDSTARAELRGGILVRMGFPLLAALPLLGLLIWATVRRALRPIHALSRDLRTRESGDLASLSTRDVPAEIRPLIDEVNRLLDRVRVLLDAERRFTADAAHELRTPLAVLRANTEVALGAPGAEARERALGTVLRATDRMTHLVDQLLVMARLDAEAARADAEPTDLGAVVDDVCAGLREAAAVRAHTLLVTRYAPARVRAQRTVLHAMVRNLLDNALRYTPDGGSVEVRFGCIDQRVRLSVRDNGPGIPEADRVRVFERFFRIAGPETAGCGLGLSIVRRSADLCGATLALGPGLEGRGLAVNVVFPGRCVPEAVADLATVAGGPRPASRA